MIRGFATILSGATAFLSLLSGAKAQDASSDLGTFNAPEYPFYLAQDHTRSASPPWGNNTDAICGSMPNTGVVRKYDFTISRGTASPGGVKRSVILVNGQFPGPTIEANWGDTFQVTVHNNLDTEGSSIHWHGLLQKGTQSMDGVPGIDICPLSPGQSVGNVNNTRVFTFRADSAGSSWWHSHYSAQYAAGLFGPMIIHGPVQQGVKYDVDKGPVILSDWAYPTYEKLVFQAVGANQSGIVRSNISLINGKTNSVFNITSGKSYRMRLVNTAAEASYVFSIDEHNFTVIAHDFVPVQPYVTNNITLAVAQRADIIIQATGDPKKSYYMRSEPTCSAVDGTGALAVIYYQNANVNAKPASKPWKPNLACAFPDASVGIPVCSATPPSTPGDTTTLNVTFNFNATNNPLWFINNSSFRVNYNEPPLLLASQGNTSFPKGWNTYNHGNADSVFIVVYNSVVGVQHPMHLHGHNYWVLSQGYGKWNGKINVPNAQNPVRRDTYLINGAKDANTPAHLVIGYKQDNPGVWPFHCHIAWHVSGGLYTTQIEKPSQIGRQPDDAFDTCKRWAAWQGRGNIVNQIDSGE